MGTHKVSRILAPVLLCTLLLSAAATPAPATKAAKPKATPKPVKPAPKPAAKPTGLPPVDTKYNYQLVASILAAVKSNAVNQSTIARSEKDTVYNPKAVKGFVTRSGNKFKLYGKTFYVAGTNAFYAVASSILKDSDVAKMFRTHAQAGATVMRVFAFSNGYGDKYVPIKNPIQPRLGKYNEWALRRLDRILAEASKNGVRLILPLSNWDDFMGGVRWWVTQTKGGWAEKEAFYYDSKVVNAYKSYVRMILNRRNTITGRIYKKDPTVLSWQVMNEPKTTNEYEKKKGQYPGTLVNNWMRDIAGYIKRTGAVQMVSNGEEGYRVDGPNSDPWDSNVGQSTFYNAWINTGFKGTDWPRNCRLNEIDFCTVHHFPANWGMTGKSWDWAVRNWLPDVMRIGTKDIGKPVLLEEIGAPANLNIGGGSWRCRNKVLRTFAKAAFERGASGVLTWSAHHRYLNNLPENAVDYGYGQDGGCATKALYTYAVKKTIIAIYRGDGAASRLKYPGGCGCDS